MSYSLFIHKEIVKENEKASQHLRFLQNCFRLNKKTLQLFDKTTFFLSLQLQIGSHLNCWCQLCERVHFTFYSC